MSWSESDLKQNLKEQLCRVYLLYGEETYLTAQYTARIAGLAVSEDLGGFNLQSFDGDTARVEQIEEAINALPLMAEQKCVILRDIDMTAGDFSERLLPLLEEPPETTVTVLSFLHLQPQPKKNAKWKKLLETVEKTGAVVCFSKKTAAELARILCSGAVRRGCTLSPQNAARLVEQCGEDMLLLAGELDKLAALADGGEITAQLIESAATKNLDAKVFDLSKAILRHNRDGAYGILNTLLQQQEDPIAILAVLSNAYADMYRVKIAQSAGNRPDAVAKAFSAYKGKEFRLRYAAQDAAPLSVPALRHALDILAQADTQLKQSRVPPRFVLEEVLAKLL